MTLPRLIQSEFTMNNISQKKGTGPFSCKKEGSLYSWTKHQKKGPVPFFPFVDITLKKVACPLFLFAGDAFSMDNKEKKEIK